MKKQQGFSLVELMIVVAIIGALTAIAMPMYNDYLKKTEATAGLATLKSLQTLAQIYDQENGGFPEATVEGLKKIGARGNMNNLGIISIVQANKSLVFTFGDDIVSGDSSVSTLPGSSSIGGGILTATLGTDGWKCVASGKHLGVGGIELDSCSDTPPAP